MAQFTQVELNSIREVVMGHRTVASKLSNYAQQCQDPQIRQMFEKASQEAKKSCQNLLNML